MNSIYTLKHSLPTGFEPVLRLIIQVCVQQKVPYYVAGATARDIVLYHIFDRTPGRQTRDIDTAILVSNWKEYEKVQQALIQVGLVATLESHRLRHPQSQLPVDIIPFGSIADFKGQIQWPPEHEVIMSVAGFKEAYHAALTVQLDETTQLKVASCAGLALLKLMAWLDRGIETSKDATDLFTLIKEYEHLQVDRLYEAFIPVEWLNYDPTRMGAYLLGYDMSALQSDETTPRIDQIRAGHIERLIDAIAKQYPARSNIRIDQLVQDLFVGLSMK